MVSIQKKVVWDHWECEVKCKSTDTKPLTEISNGSILTEIDTGNVYLFDGDTATWVFQFSLQG